MFGPQEGHVRTWQWRESVDKLIKVASEILNTVGHIPKCENWTLVARTQESLHTSILLIVVVGIRELEGVALQNIARRALVHKYSEFNLLQSVPLQSVKDAVLEV